MNLALSSVMSRPRMPYFSLASTTMERPSGVSSASEASCAASASSCSLTPRKRLELGGLAVAERDGAGLVEQKGVDVAAASTARPDIASTLKRTRRSMPAMPIADSSAPIVVGIKVTNSATSTTIGDRCRRRTSAKLGMVAVAKTKMMVMPASRMLSAISLGVFCRSAPSTSLIMRSRKVEPAAEVMRTRIQSDMHLGSAGHRRAVAAGLADDGGRLAGDGRLVDRSDALDHLAVAGDEVAGLDQHDVADLEAGARDELVVLGVWRRSAAWPASRCACAAASPPAPCRGLRPRPPRSWRTAP